MGNVTKISLNVDSFSSSLTGDIFGRNDANEEWVDPIGSSISFFQNSTYSDFKKDLCLFLFGRRGTGKTALIRMYHNQIQNGAIDKYLGSSIMKEEKAYLSVKNAVSNTPMIGQGDEHIASFFQDKWMWNIQVYALLAAINSNYIDNSSKDYKLIYSYLQTIGMKDQGRAASIWSHVRDIIVSAFDDIEYENMKIGKAVNRIYNLLNTKEHAEAIRALDNICKKEKRKVLVFIDSVEVYNTSDKISMLAVQSLISHSQEMHYENEAIDVKVALPLEIFHYIRFTNPGKSRSHILFIFWSNKELVCMLAKRFYRAFNDKTYDYKSLDKYENSKRYLKKYLPEKYTVLDSFKFDTIANIIRHTQKKPRHLIELMNTIYTYAEFVGADTSNVISDDVIGFGIHSKIDGIIDESLSIYEETYPDIKKIVFRIASEMKPIVSHKELVDKIREVHSLFDKNNLSNKEDVIQLLISAGILGISNNGTEKDGIYIFEAEFSFQIQRSLPFCNETKFAIHPMLYEICKCNTNDNQFVIPRASSDEEQMNQLISAL